MHVKPEGDVIPMNELDSLSNHGGVDAAKPAKKSVRKAVRTFALDQTSAHGLPNIFRAKRRPAQLLWAVIFFLGTVGLFYQGTLLVMMFLDYPVNVEVNCVENERNTDTVQVKIVTRPSLEFPSVTVCNTNKLRKSAVDKSKHRQMLVVDRTTSLPYYAPCVGDDFLCKRKTKCIKRYLLCDGIRQCGTGDASDEHNCDYTSHECPSDHFRCSLSGSPLGVCIPASKKCNRREDCYKGEDEDDCVCKISEFHCKRHGGCIRREKLCNGHKDCRDGSDESEETCNASMFVCGSGGRPIPEILKCDGIRDCPDNSDEEECAPPVLRSSFSPVFECEAGKFHCGLGECIPESWKCDMAVDCKTGADEALEICGRPDCLEPEDICPVGGGCGILCDLNPDCVNATDEINCNCYIFKTDSPDVPAQKITCIGLSSGEYYEAREYTYQAICKGGNHPNKYYRCSEAADCFDPETNLPEPCKAVYSECYVSPNGRDYQGMLGLDLPDCLPWSDPEVALLNYTGDKYWELEGFEPGSTVSHNFCRNPGGVLVAPWCFQRSGTLVPNDGTLEFDNRTLVPNNGTLIPVYCPRPSLPKPICHSAIFDLKLWFRGSSESNRRGFVEVGFEDIAVGTISDNDWTMNDADVVCRQLGFPFGAIGTNCINDKTGVPDRVLLKDVQCTGDEWSLTDCFYRLATDEDTDHSHDVCVACNRTDAAVRRGKRSVDSLTTGEKTVEEAYCPSCSLNRSLKRSESDDKNASDCGGGRFLCKSGECIRYWKTCNSVPDCVDGSDEWLEDCEDIVTECSPNEFQCLEKTRDGFRKCIPKRFVCDDYNDCGKVGPVSKGTTRASDEKRCPRKGEAAPPGYIRCPDIPKFIHEHDVCNTVSDCYTDKYDEKNCFNRVHKDKFSRDAVFRDPEWYLPYTSMVPDDNHYLFNEFVGQYSPPPFGRIGGDDPPDWNRFMTFSATADYSDLVRVAELSQDEVHEMGHQFEDFILQCTYEQGPCNISNFTPLLDDQYGNCYTFNDKDTKINASKTGSTYGLQMTMFLEQSEYISIFGQEAGVRVSINPPHVRPNPTDNGMTIQPGTVTSIGLRYNYVMRRGKPYGDCMKKVKSTKIIVDGDIRLTSPSEQYDRALCRKTCIHEQIRNHCGCSDTLELDGPRCKLMNETQEMCRQLVYFISQYNNLNCFESCPEQCNEGYYTRTSSMSMWPSINFRSHLLRNIHSINKKTKELNQETVYDNIVRLEVFYEELNYEITKEVPAYQESALFGDIGGIAGLYIGCSLITICEFIMFGFKLAKRITMDKIHSHRA